MATGETGREEEQDAKSPHWVSESCSFVRYPALLFPTVICLVSCVWRRRGGGSRPTGRVVEQVRRTLFFCLFFLLSGCTRLLLLLLLLLFLCLMELRADLPGSRGYAGRW